MEHKTETLSKMLDKIDDVSNKCDALTKLLMDVKNTNLKIYTSDSDKLQMLLELTIKSTELGIAGLQMSLPIYIAMAVSDTEAFSSES